MQDHNPLYHRIRQIILEARGQVAQTANWALAKSNWEIGQTIVEDEQHGEKRVAYGKGLLKDIVAKLTEELVSSIPIVTFDISGSFTSSSQIGTHWVPIFHGRTTVFYQG